MPEEIRGEDVILLVASGATGAFEFDPIRLMKGAFLVAQRGPTEWRDFFDFEPYSYGPFDSSVYVMRDNLLARGLLRSRSLSSPMRRLLSVFSEPPLSSRAC
jgi:hypothetical protein